MIQIDTWQFVTLAFAMLSSIVGGLWTVARIASKQLDDRLEARFDMIEEVLKTLGSERRADGDKLHKIELELAQLRGEMPLNYVRREDYIRGQTVLEAKLDALYSKLENVQINGVKHHAS